MRQAGRYLPEYRELRKKHSMLELIRTPKLATEVTLQPLRRFDLDGSIIFADILNPLIGMGFELDFIDGEGPKIFNKVKNLDDVRALTIPNPRDSVDYTLEAIDLVSSELNQKNIPLLGFAGAPFTLSAYLVESKAKGFNGVKEFMFNNFEAWDELQNKLVEYLTEYLVSQVEAGVSGLQVFDSWLGHLSLSQYQIYVKPYLEKLFDNLQSRVNVPLVFFGTGINTLFPEIAKLQFDVIGIDWRSDFEVFNTIFKDKKCIQGNLDPALLLTDWSHVEKEAKLILDQTKNIPHVFNLGHGILPQAKIENVEKLINLIHS
ncbi:UNVERIFIED_CONTAM: hypothetical protein GTU68_033703 [Idotea baltica]|nr:hypothetical protein [Idotea baltica]